MGRAWLWSLVVGLSMAGVACGGTADIAIGGPEGGGGDSGQDAPAMDRAPPDARDGSGGGDTSADVPNDTTLHDSTTEASDTAPPPDGEADGPFFDAPFDVQFDSPSDSPPDSPMDSATCPTVCVPPVPGGWSGPDELYQGSAFFAPGCGSAFESSPDYSGNGMLSAPPATCSTCTCDLPTGVTCSDVGAVFFSDSACTAPCGTAAALPPSTCTDISSDVTACTASSAGAYVKLTAPIVTGGKCNPSTETPFIMPPSWGQSAEACTPMTVTSTGCTGGNLCVPTTDPFFGSSYCVHKSGVAACPAGSGYTQQTIFYGSYTDTRSCSDCGCGNPSEASCSTGANVESYSDMCMTPTGVFSSLPENCGSVPASTTSLELMPGISVGGMCTPFGGHPKGSATPTSPTTFCCTP